MSNKSIRPVLAGQTNPAAPSAPSTLNTAPQIAGMLPGETVEQFIARLTAENEALRAAKSAPKNLSVKVSGQGAVSIYGLNSNFPITLYGEQVEKLAEHMAEIVAFKRHMATLKYDNGATVLSVKGDDKIEVPNGKGLTPRTNAFVLGTDLAKWAASPEGKPLLPTLVDVKARK